MTREIEVFLKRGNALLTKNVRTARFETMKQIPALTSDLSYIREID